jgi:hypothetical protein
VATSTAKEFFEGNLPQAKAHTSVKHLPTAAAAKEDRLPGV